MEKVRFFAKKRDKIRGDMYFVKIILIKTKIGGGKVYKETIISIVILIFIFGLNYITEKIQTKR